jgi:KDO2-lipid IV(A) lauroyltransferase
VPRPARRFASSVASALSRLADRFAAAGLRAAAAILPTVPARAALALADAIAAALYLLDARGRRVGRDNLRAVLGDEVSRAERTRILRASYRNAARSLILLFHVQPTTARRWGRFVSVDADLESRMREGLARSPKVVFASGHFGNWEMALAARTVLPYAPDSDYLTETTGMRRVDELFERLRDRGSAGGSRRKGGALALKHALDHGRSVALLVDRNVRGWHGGRYVPFLGIPARTTPLPAVLSRHYRVPLLVLLCVPDGDAHWRLWLSPDLSGPFTDDVEADVAAATERMNAVLSRVIREHPEGWAWMIKRWKSRPTPEVGPYPSYSIYDPE